VSVDDSGLPSHDNVAGLLFTNVLQKHSSFISCDTPAQQLQGYQILHMMSHAETHNVTLGVQRTTLEHTATRRWFTKATVTHTE
jgi:hypothetical protein